MRRWIVVVFGVAAAAGGLIPAARPQDGRRPVAPVRLDAAAVASAHSALEALVVADRVRGGYHRDLFGDGWSVGADGCTTRQLVLMVERVAGTVAGCAVVDGVWLDWYDGRVLVDPAAVEVDHLVPLAHAWQAGAWAWPAPRRVAFANDVTTPATLTAVSAAQNQAKGAAPPDGWQPPVDAARCRYAVDWVTVKATWQLTVTAAEREALRSMLDRCGVDREVAQ